MGEFDLIAHYFTRPVRRAALGVGDDCALLRIEPGMQLAVSSDMLVAGRHFFDDVNPVHLGHKSLAVNLSDLAASGARPLAFTLALSLPAVDEPWLKGFAQGLLALADAHDIELVGGDTTHGPLNICITAFGEVPPGKALLRSGALPGDDIWVSGTLGDARLALDAALGKIDPPLPPEVLDAARERLECPTPRVALGMALRGIASSALDLSDGLLGDLTHILEQSQVGAQIDADAALQTMAARAFAPALRLADTQWLECVLAGGDDYELAFTAPAALRVAVQDAACSASTRVTRIGSITAGHGIRVLDANGRALPRQRWDSFDHFA
ncbi:thiamine-phosphate kinase [Diaphorobacter aerolatus]|uniref:Thiamine-monophosphate kinase n=1 Tax=Diaphorobacter aerolatus TaxID=1288495 RepID=A0A7H0GPP4_9BURK|nr:thiamine-phosphate kinase [Diaphorobacter aerolatus]QNP50260.1 thiamine-phosphate kinase [Diaphorobacter aerolatus]